MNVFETIPERDKRVSLARMPKCPICGGLNYRSFTFGEAGDQNCLDCFASWYPDKPEIPISFNRQTPKINLPL